MHLLKKAAISLALAFGVMASPSHAATVSVGSPVYFYFDVDVPAGEAFWIEWTGDPSDPLDAFTRYTVSLRSKLGESFQHRVSGSNSDDRVISAHFSGGAVNGLIDPAVKFETDGATYGILSATLTIGYWDLTSFAFVPTSGPFAGTTTDPSLVPLPGALPLMLLGLGGLALGARRHNRQSA